MSTTDVTICGQVTSEDDVDRIFGAMIGERRKLGEFQRKRLFVNVSPGRGSVS